MADASSHYKEMKYFMGAEFLVPGIKKGELQGIDDASNGINDASGQQPQECSRGKSVQKLPEHQDAYPAHGDIDDGGKPFGTGDPAGLDDHAGQSDAPDQSQQSVAQVASQHNQAHRGVGACDQHEDHHMIHLAENAKSFSGEIDRVVGGAGAVQQDHAYHENSHGSQALGT